LLWWWWWWWWYDDDDDGKDSDDDDDNGDTYNDDVPRTPMGINLSLNISPVTPANKVRNSFVISSDK
jgi:hypothetical protein